MYEMMKHILILRYKARVAGRIIVRTENSVNARIFPEKSDDSIECIFLHQHIVVQKDKVITHRRRGASIPGVGRAMILCQPDNPGRIFPDTGYW
jgi:hypothetical protein